MTDDIDKWSNSLSQIYSNFTKPMLDIILFSKRLSNLLGYTGPLLVILWYLFSGIFIKFVSPAFGKLTAIGQLMEGDYRRAHSDIVHHSEEIGFYKVNKKKKIKSLQKKNK
jgi:ATP-binding cassette, subfamily D (ALD), member 3